MDGNKSNISFIPKKSLVRSESFLERPRPRSAIGFLAVIILILSIGSYVGLSFYKDTIDKKITAMTGEINNTQKRFEKAPQVEEAQIFLSRMSIAKEIMDAHVVASPVLEFISDNTISSVMFESFSLKQDGGSAIVELPGEAPTYAALAYQGDVLRKKTKELSSFLIHNVSLTEDGTVKFSLTLDFAPGFMSYVKNLRAVPEVPVVAPKTEIINPTTKVATSSVVSGGLPAGSSVIIATSTNTLPIALPRVSTTSAMSSKVSPSTVQVSAVKQEQSVFRSMWEKFKFW